LQSKNDFISDQEQIKKLENEKQETEKKAKYLEAKQGHLLEQQRQ